MTTRSVSVTYLYVFPDGHFNPKWSRWLVAAIIAYDVTWGLSPDAPFNVWNLNGWPLGLIIALSWLFAGLALQTYRYRRCYSPPQRQQDKWVFFGAFVLITMLAIVYLPSTIIPALQQPGLLRLLNTLLRDPIFLLAMLFSLACMVIAILRYRLWDIDVLACHRRAVCSPAPPGAEWDRPPFLPAQIRRGPDLRPCPKIT